MKKIPIILILVLVLASFAGHVAADRDRGERHEGYGKFYGVVENMPESGYTGIWVINGREVQAANNTVIEEKHGRASVGAFAEVKGRQSEDMFTAYKIEIKQGKDFKQGAYPGKFYGTIEKLPEKGWQGIWTINGREILATGHTKIKEKYGRVAVGAHVKVEGNYSGNKFTAYEIEVKGDKRYRSKTSFRDKTYGSRTRDKLPRSDRSYNSRFAGVIESMPQEVYEGLWVVDGRKVEVNNKTSIDEIEGKASVGAYVKIKGIRKGKTITAYVIEIINLPR